MDILFLDANILFSAVYRENAGLLQLWKLKNINLITSAYAIEEAKRNLKEKVQHARLQALIKKLTVVAEGINIAFPPGTILAEKDHPILAAAIAAGATYLITGDFKDFGIFFKKKIKGVTVLPPIDYIQSFSKK